MLGIHLNSNIILEKCWFLCLHTSDSCGQMRYVLGFSIHPSVGYLLGSDLKTVREFLKI